jgi:hypothetical protein
VDALEWAVVFDDGARSGGDIDGAEESCSYDPGARARRFSHDLGGATWFDSISWV